MENTFKIENDDRNFWIKIPRITPFHELHECTGQSRQEVVEKLHAQTCTRLSWHARGQRQCTHETPILMPREVDEVLFNLNNTAAQLHYARVLGIYADGSEYLEIVDHEIVSTALIVSQFIRFMHYQRGFISVGVVIHTAGQHGIKVGALVAATKQAAVIYGGLVGLS